ncbi:DUF6090 family protein [Robiginitalea sp. SC105]|uniref:DUF6090 family protein n=1 Tax=Robiginitalea sp. SC105 TaxID=2762332 RepID=UPI001639F849|nr:DUF6090 family protein [Robiginitalea sp. SC105]MBC2838751.1 hypothetical protein [Robiginitalea sp. SC105]
MISLFRKIRRGLLARNRLTTYLLYALGEVLLVVIGILLALRVDNYNESVKISRQKNAILGQVADDIRRNLGDLRLDKALHLQGLKSNRRIAKLFRGEQPFDQALAFDFYYLKKDEFTTPPTAGYENLKALGLEHVEDEQLRNVLKGMYESLYPRLSREYQFYPDLDTYFSGYYLEHFRIFNDTAITHDMVLDTDSIRFPIRQTFQGVPVTRHIGYLPLDYESLIQDSRFESMVRESLDFRLYKLSRYNNLITLSGEALERIAVETGNMPLE